jgi:hypothetical protein
MSISFYHRLFYRCDQIGVVQKSSFPGFHLIGSGSKRYRSSGPPQRVYNTRFPHRTSQASTKAYQHHLRTFSSSAVSRTAMSNIPQAQTFVYSTVDKLEVKLDLYVPPNATGSLPAIICFHSGGLMVGDRYPGPMPTAAWLLGSFNLPIFIDQNLFDSFRDGHSKWT